MFRRRIAFPARRRATLSGARWIFLALAIGSLLVLRPVCLAQAAVLGAHNHAAHSASGSTGSDDPDCCAAIADPLLANVGDTAAGFAKNSAATAPFYIAAVFTLLILLAPRSRSAPGALERLRPYCARSARILR